MKMKRFLSIFLAVALLLGLMPVMGVSATEESGTLSGGRWKLDRGTGVLTISGDGDVFCPTENLAFWAEWAEEIRTVVVEEGVTSVSYGAFSACQWVEEFYISSTVKEISYPESPYLSAFHVAEGSETFAQVDGVLFSKDLKTLIRMPRGYMGSYTVPNTVTEIGDSAFMDCHGLMEVVLPEGLTEIKYGTFCNCTSLLKVSLPNSLKKIRASAFENCRALERIALPEGLTTLETSAFYGAGLRSAKIPDSVVKYGGAFLMCNYLETLTVGKGVLSNLEMDYRNSPSLEKVTVSAYNPAYYCDEKGVLYDKEKKTLLAAPMAMEGEYKVLPGVDTVFIRAFGGCYKLTSVQLPEELTSIADEAFSKCYSLTSVNIPGSVQWIGLAAFDSCKSLKAVQLPEDLTYLGDYAFAGSGLTEITIPEGYREIPDGTFHGCGKLECVEIPESVEYIGDQAFAECDSLRNLSVPGKDTYISTGAFGSYLSMEAAFETTGGLETLEISPENENFAVDSVGAIYNSDMTYLYFVPASVEGTFTIASTCEDVSIFAFWGSTFHTLVIPKGMVEYSVFRDAYGPNIRKYEVEEGHPDFSADEQGALYNKEMTTLLRLPGGFQGAYYAPEGLTYAESYAFDGCKELTEVRLGNNYRGLDFGIPGSGWIPKLLVSEDHPECVNDEKGVLYSKDMAQLLHAPKDLEGDYTIPATVGLIYGDAFRDCTKLTGVDLSLCRAATIGEYAFAGCTALEWVKFPEALRALFDRSFYGCTALESVELPRGLERMDGSPFEDCTALRTAVIPATVKEMGPTFWNCTGLRTVRFLGDRPIGFELGFTYFEQESGLDHILSKVTVEFSCEAKGFTAPYCSGVSTKVFSPDARNCTGEDCSCASFSDIPEAGHWAHNAIEELLNMGLVKGVGKNRFDPEGTMTRAMLVTILYRLEGSPEVWDCPFTDVPANVWYTDAVTWAGGMGIVQGIGDGRYAPEEPVTREQVATILCRYLGLEGETGRGRASLASFADEASVSSYAREALERMVMKGIINGKGTNLDPLGTATRAEVATILWRLLEFTQGNEG